VPLNGLGYFLRTTGAAGSFEELLETLRHAEIRGVEPVEIVARDMLRPVAAQPELRLRITNVLNRAVSGTLQTELAVCSSISRDRRSAWRRMRRKTWR